MFKKLAMINKGSFNYPFSYKKTRSLKQLRNLSILVPPPQVYQVSKNKNASKKQQAIQRQKIPFETIKQLTVNKKDSIVLQNISLNRIETKRQKQYMSLLGKVYNESLIQSKQAKSQNMIRKQIKFTEAMSQMAQIKWTKITKQVNGIYQSIQNPYSEYQSLRLLHIGIKKINQHQNQNNSQFETDESVSQSHQKWRINELDFELFYSALLQKIAKDLPCLSTNQLFMAFYLLNHPLARISNNSVVQGENIDVNINEVRGLINKLIDQQLSLPISNTATTQQQLFQLYKMVVSLHQTAERGQRNFREHIEQKTEQKRYQIQRMPKRIMHDFSHIKVRANQLQVIIMGKVISNYQAFVTKKLLDQKQKAASNALSSELQPRIKKMLQWANFYMSYSQNGRSDIDINKQQHQKYVQNAVKMSQIIESLTQRLFKSIIKQTQIKFDKQNQQFLGLNTLMRQYIISLINLFSSWVEYYQLSIHLQKCNVNQFDNLNCRALYRKIQSILADTIQTSLKLGFVSLTEQLDGKKQENDHQIFKLCLARFSNNSKLVGVSLKGIFQSAQFQLDPLRTFQIISLNSANSQKSIQKLVFKTFSFQKQCLYVLFSLWRLIDSSSSLSNQQLKAMYQQLNFNQFLNQGKTKQNILQSGVAYQCMAIQLDLQINFNGYYIRKWLQTIEYLPYGTQWIVKHYALSSFYNSADQKMGIKQVLKVQQLRELSLQGYSEELRYLYQVFNIIKNSLRRNKKQLSMHIQSQQKQMVNRDQIQTLNKFLLTLRSFKFQKYATISQLDQINKDEDYSTTASLNFNVQHLVDRNHRIIIHCLETQDQTFDRMLDLKQKLYLKENWRFCGVLVSQFMTLNYTQRVRILKQSLQQLESDIQIKNQQMQNKLLTKN